MKKTLWRFAAAGALVAVFGFAAPAFAAEPDYGTNVSRKLGRGFSNAAFGWMEVLKGVEKVGAEQNFIAGITWGPLYGTGNTIIRTTVGLFEIGTFLFPVPDGFKPILQPEFVIEGDRA